MFLTGVLNIFKFLKPMNFLELVESKKMARRFEGKVCVVTASATGIGLAIATRLAAEGGKVVISSRQKKNVDAAVSELKAKGFEASGFICHVGKAEDRTALINFAVH
jgi:NAD(P)-dependent dehydrogenase (short-subunit alcohol dehydrogenase family)